METFEHNPGDHEDPLSGPTWTLGIIGIVLLVVSVLGVAAVFYDEMGKERGVKVLDRPTLAVEGLKSAQLRRLHDQPHVELRVEGEESIVIPIEDAMTAVVREAGGGG